MNSVKNLNKGIKCKNYGVKAFNGVSVNEKRRKWLDDNPEIIILNTHVLWDGNMFHHIFEYFKEK
jgi:hypothetical protein